MNGWEERTSREQDRCQIQGAQRTWQKKSGQESNSDNLMFKKCLAFYLHASTKAMKPHKRKNSSSCVMGGSTVYSLVKLWQLVITIDKSGIHGLLV